MKPALHYNVKVKIIRFIEDGNIGFEEFEHTFKNNNPILARTAAFEYYQNYIETLLEAKQLNYISDKQARADLQSFYGSVTKSKYKMGDNGCVFYENYGNGIGVYIVIDIPKDDEMLSEKPEEEMLLHGIGNLFGYDTDSIISHLETEFDYYKHYKYDISDMQTSVVYCSYCEWMEGYRENEPLTYEILETPFNWEGYNKPYWWGEPEEDEVKQQQLQKPYLELIKGGESNQIEFKPCLLYYHSKEDGKSGYRMFVRHIIAQVICSFLNSNGGYLFVGVDDHGKPQGLKDDFSLVRPAGKNPKDYFNLEVDKIIREYFKDVANNIFSEFAEIDGVEIYVFTVFPSKAKPIFITGPNGKEFFVRLSTSCEPYTDIEKIANYCISKWGNLNK